MDYTILVGGAAGQGIDTVVHLLERTIKRSGYYVFTYKNFMSMVRGGHNFMQVRFSDKPITTFTTKVDMIFALNEDSPLIYEIASSALSVYPQQYGVLKYGLEEGFDYSTKKVNVDDWAASKGIENSELLNFKDYSKNTFGSRTYNRVLEELISIGGYTEDEMVKMANMVTDLNLRYFEGTINSIKKDLVKTPIYKLFIDINSEYLYDSVYNMIHNGNRDSSTLKMPN